MRLIPTPRIETSLEALASVPELAGRVALVTDAGLVAAGHAGRTARLAGGVVATWDQCETDPTAEAVHRCADALRRAGPLDALLAVGGGSVIDTAKAANLLLAHEGRSILDFRGHTAARSAAQLVAVVTTAGTGTEGQCSALISDPRDHAKVACLAPGLAVDVAILDPVLTLTQPARVTAACGLDALTHALETSVTTARTPTSDALSRRAFTTAWRALPAILARPDDLAARGAMLTAAHDAGAAIAHSMLGAAHATGNAWTARHGVTHGFAVARMLPAVMAYNSELAEVRAIYASLADEVGLSGAPELIAAVARLVDATSPALPASPDLDRLVAAAELQWTGRFNPRPVDAAVLRSLFAQAVQP